jgi:hypothetical protein
LFVDIRREWAAAGDTDQLVRWVKNNLMTNSFDPGADVCKWLFTADRGFKITWRDKLAFKINKQNVVGIPSSRRPASRIANRIQWVMFDWDTLQLLEEDSGLQEAFLEHLQYLEEHGLSDLERDEEGTDTASANGQDSTT